MPFTIVRQDITKMKVDAIVNAANTEFAMGGGVCGAIFRATGAGKLQAACNKVAPIKTGEAALTPGFSLPCRYVIHAVGPVYHRQDPARSAALLHEAYTSSLRLAVETKCQSIAFPLISSGIFGYPKSEALQVATEAISDFLITHDMDVYLAVFDKSSFTVSTQLLGDVDSYIDEHYVEMHLSGRRKLLDVEYEALEKADIDQRCSPNASAPLSLSNGPAKGLDELVGHLDEPFSQTLLHLIDATGKSDVAVYKRANIDRKLFSKMRTTKGYIPSKRTALALAIALELTLPETDDLLGRAGYALSHAQKFDVIVEYFIVNGKYDIFEINEVLFQYDQPLLGG